jgi:1,2-diacylglycerol 3-beta-galactosyltransferase
MPRAGVAALLGERSMGEPTEERPLQLLLLFSDTGGGHRSAAEALIESWRAEHPGRVAVEMVDVFRHHTPFPFSRFGPSYPWIVRYFSRIYGSVFHKSDSPARARVVAKAVYRYVRPHLARLLLEHPSDALVSVHPLFNHCVNWTMRDLGLHRPYITVVTDLWTAHAFWFYPHVTHIIVPTEGARQRGLSCGVPVERITVRGLPVARRFTQALRQAPGKPAVRARLGLAPAGRVVLIVGGGDGMGPLFDTTRAIDAALPINGPPPQLVIITGRNAALRRRLRAHPWRLPIRIEGFVSNMPEWMAAADVLVTKAGPGTITEGLLSGLPLVLIGKVPGQEDGNVDFVVENGVGAWEPQPERAAATLRVWLEPSNAVLPLLSERARQLAPADAASDIAADILDLTARKEYAACDFSRFAKPQAALTRPRAARVWAASRNRSPGD